MSLRRHRSEREQKKFHKARMPSTSEAKLGTRVHDDKREQGEVPDVGKCSACDGFTELPELDEFRGKCYECSLIDSYDPKEEDVNEVPDV